MATKKFNYIDSEYLSWTTAGSWLFEGTSVCRLFPEGENDTANKTAKENILKNIPKYSKITNVKLGVTFTPDNLDSGASDSNSWVLKPHYFSRSYKSDGSITTSRGSIGSDSVGWYKNEINVSKSVSTKDGLKNLVIGSHNMSQLFCSETVNSGLLRAIDPNLIDVHQATAIGFEINFTGTSLRKVSGTFKDAWIEYEFTPPTISLYSVNTSFGNIVYNSGKNIEKNDQIYSMYVDGEFSVTAFPKEGYRFEKWSDGNTEKTRTFTTKDNVQDVNNSFTAYFVPYYTITYEVNEGTGHENGPNFYDSTYGELTNDLIPTGVKNVVLPILTKTGYTFQGWTGPNLSEPTRNVTIPLGSEGNKKYTAHWTINQYQVNIVCSPEVAGTGEISLADGTLFTSAKLDYNTSLVSISAKSSKNEKYSFDHFSITKQVNTTNNPIIGQKVPAYNITYTAHFIKKKYNITAKTVVLIDGKEQNIDCARFELNNSSEFAPQYYDDVVLISFIPKAGYKFIRWKNIAGDDQYKSVLSVKIQGDRNLVAIFEKIDLQEDSIPEGTNPNSELVTNITEAIISKNIVNFVNTKPMSQIGDYAFYNCKKLQLVSIPSINNKPLGSKAFKGCENLVSLRLPIGITHIPEESFANCKNLTTLVIPGNKPTLSSIDAFLNTPFTNILVSKYDETDSIDHTFGYIYVNDALDYENDTNWGALAGHYRNIGDFPEVNEVFKEE